MAKKKTSLIDAIAELIAFLIKLLWGIITLPFKIIKHLRKKKKKPQAEEELIRVVQAPIYKRKYLLTRHEWDFYKALKPIADKLQLTVLSKIRMADLVETVADSNSDYYRGFAKVKAKHVDFALARPDNLYVELLIELDDSTHTEGNERDAFVESVYQMAGYRLLRVRNTLCLEDEIKTALSQGISL